MEIERLKSLHSQELKKINEGHEIALEHILTCQSQIKDFEDEIKTLKKQLLQGHHQLVTKVSLAISKFIVNRKVY